MERRTEMMAMLLAGGQGSRLYDLTSNVAKPAVRFGGKYRIIDFPLSNSINSGVYTVGILTQYRPLYLSDYIGNGEPWDLDRQNGGVHILPPYQRSEGGDWYKGTANAIYQNIEFIDSYNPDHVLILSGDHIYKMDYRDMLRLHKESNAAVTIAVLEVPLEEASRFGIMSVDENDVITEFEEKPKNPKSTLASMGIYIFTKAALYQYLIEDAKKENSSNDFGKDIIPAMLESGEKMLAYRFSGYWKDVGTLSSLWEANMDLLGENSPIDLGERGQKVYYRHSSSSPHFIADGAKVVNAIISEGCEIRGNVIDSVLSDNVTVEEGATVSGSVVMSSTIIKSGAKVEYAIIANDVIIGPNSVVGDTGAKEVTLVAEDVHIAQGIVIKAGERINKDIR